jgi:hypothetical protein
VLIQAGTLQCLVGELESLKAKVASHDSRIADIAFRQDEDCDRFSRDIAYDRRRLARLEAPPDPTPSHLVLHLARTRSPVMQQPI